MALVRLTRAIPFSLFRGPILWPRRGATSDSSPAFQRPGHHQAAAPRRGQAEKALAVGRIREDRVAIVAAIHHVGSRPPPSATCGAGGGAWQAAFLSKCPRQFSCLCVTLLMRILTSRNESHPTLKTRQTPCPEHPTPL